MTTHSSILAWRIPWTEEPGGLLSMGTHSSTRGLRPPEQLERPAGFPSSDKTRPDSPVPTLQGPCGRQTSHWAPPAHAHPLLPEGPWAPQPMPVPSYLWSPGHSQPTPVPAVPMDPWVPPAHAHPLLPVDPWAPLAHTHPSSLWTPGCPQPTLVPSVPVVPRRAASLSLPVPYPGRQPACLPTGPGC